MCVVWVWVWVWVCVKEERERERERVFILKRDEKIVGRSNRLWPFDLKSEICGSKKLEANRIFRANNGIWGNVIFPLALHGMELDQFGPGPHLFFLAFLSALILILFHIKSKLCGGHGIIIKITYYKVIQIVYTSLKN